MVEIYTRDINGKRDYWQVDWQNGNAFIDLAKTSEDEEILFILFNGTCIYSQLANGPIDWEDVVGFFA